MLRPNVQWTAVYNWWTAGLTILPRKFDLWVIHRVIKDIKVNPNKYILVSFQGYSEDIFPAAFKGRQVLDVTQSSGLDLLNAKLQNETIIDFSAVAKSKPKINKKKIASFPFGSTPDTTSVDISTNNPDSSSALNSTEVKELRNLLTKNKFKKVFATLFSKLDQSSDAHQAVAIMEREYDDMKYNERMGLTTFSQISPIKNSIMLRLLKLIDENS